MAHFMIQVSYTPEGWAAQVNSPTNILERTKAAVEKAGGKAIGAWYTFGEYDVVAIGEFPGNVNAAAYAMAVLSFGEGTIKSYKTTPLMTVEEGMEAMQEAGAIRDSYRRPGS